MWASIAHIASIDKSSFVGIVAFIIDFHNTGTSSRLLSALHTVNLGWWGTITNEDNAYIVNNLLRERGSGGSGRGRGRGNGAPD